MKRITKRSFTKALVLAFVVGVFQQLSAQKVTVEEWTFDSNTQSNNGREFGWPSAAAGSVSGGAYTVDGANSKSGYVNFADVSSGKLTYSITLNSWELSDAGGSFWELVFYAPDNTSITIHRIISQSKTGYFATAIYTKYNETDGPDAGTDEDGWTGDIKAGKLVNGHTSAGTDGDPAYSPLPVTVNFTIDLDAETYVVWVGDGNPSDDDGTAWGRYGTAYSGDINFDRTISHLKWQWKANKDADDPINDFIEIDKIALYTGEAVPISTNTIDVNDIGVYPTINHGTFTVTLTNSKPALLEVYNTMGALVYSQNTDGAITDVTLPNIKGVYFVKISQDGLHASSQKIIVNQ